MIRSLALLALILSAPPHSRDRMTERWAMPPSASAAPPVMFGTVALQPSDMVGSWWVLNTDGTMASGSSTSFVAHASPGTSPLTFNGSTQYLDTATVLAFPTGSFSIVCSAKPTAASGTIAGDWISGELLWILAFSSDAPLFGVSDSTLSLGVAVAPAITEGSFLAFTGIYNATTGSVKLRTAGVTTTGSSTAFPTTLAPSHKVAVGASRDASSFLTGQSKGCFFTEKVLTDADADRLMPGVL